VVSTSDEESASDEETEVIGVVVSKCMPLFGAAPGLETHLYGQPTIKNNLWRSF
jgi:hypothetical protein